MDVFAFFLVTVFCWGLAVLLLIIGLLFLKRKYVGHVFLWASLGSFLIPFLLYGGMATYRSIRNYNFSGIYQGKDSLENTVYVDIMEDNRFVIRVNQCKDIAIEGKWEYAKGYDAFLFYPDSSSLSVSFYQEDGLVLNTNVSNSCCNLKGIDLVKE